MRLNDKVSDAVVSAPAGENTFAVPPTFLSANPGLLSIVWIPGNNRIVVFSVISLLLPLT